MAARALAALLALAAARAEPSDPVVSRPAPAGARPPQAQRIKLSQRDWDQLRTDIVSAPALRGSGGGAEDGYSRYPRGLMTMQFIMNVSREIPIKIEGLSDKELRKSTAIVTHTGKNNMDYIDHAVMLGRALKKFVPEYPLVAIAVEGMFEVNQELLRKAGWHVALVEDWGSEHCNGNCASNFLGRWGDSFEKLNAFRVPFAKALFLDADTYVFSGEIRDVIERSELQEGQIAMVHDTCKRKGDKDEYNSGLMFYEPDVKRFAHMLELIAEHSDGEVGDILDQRIINEEFRDQVVQLHDKFNCIDLVPKPGQRGCPAKCQEDMVVAHFTGMPKPARAAAGWLGLVRDKAQNISSSICAGTNHGCCYKYRDFYCDMTREVSFLSRNLQKAVTEAGECARPPVMVGA